MTSWQAGTALDSLNIPQLELILDEIFAIPPSFLFPDEPRPRTIGELAVASGLPVASVLRQLQEILAMSTAIEISPADLHARLQAGAATTTPPGLLLVDVRETWEFAICHLPGSILLSQTNFTALLPSLRACPLVVAVCHHGVRSYSAAMALRQHGVASAVSLAGGVAAWAVAIDPQMPTY